MRRRVQQWGNSLAVRIPKAFAIDVGLFRNAEVELEIVGGELHVTPVRPKEFSLESLVNGITPENRHDEVEFEGPLGSEAW
jgi:antitoxin MazE